MLAAMRKDKKREGDRIHFVFLDALGSACVEEIALESLSRLAKAARVE
jgi:3-dehydroquinate synthase